MCVRACVRVCVDVLHEVWECLMVFWHLVCVSWSRARDLLNGTVCTLFIMQAGPIPTGTRPWSACLLSLAPSPLLSLSLSCCWMIWLHAGRTASRMLWKRLAGPGNCGWPPPSRLLALLRSLDAPVTFILSLSLFLSLSPSLSVPGILFSLLPTTCSPPPPNPRPPPPALICVQKKCLLLERAGRTLSFHYQLLKGDYYVCCAWQRASERDSTAWRLFDVPQLPGSNNVPFSWRS